MFIFNPLVLSLTRPNFFSRAIIEPRVQAPLPAPPDHLVANAMSRDHSQAINMAGPVEARFDVAVNVVRSMPKKGTNKSVKLTKRKRIG